MLKYWWKFSVIFPPFINTFWSRFIRPFLCFSLVYFSPHFQTSSSKLKGASRPCMKSRASVGHVDIFHTFLQAVLVNRRLVYSRCVSAHGRRCVWNYSGCCRSSEAVWPCWFFTGQVHFSQRHLISADSQAKTKLENISHSTVSPHTSAGVHTWLLHHKPQVHGDGGGAVEQCRAAVCCSRQLRI